MAERQADYRHLTELEYYDIVCASLPYGRPRASEALVRIGCYISPNAAFIVLHEICRPPFLSERPSLSTLTSLLKVWAKHFDHPLKDPLLPVAEALISDTYISVERAIELMRMIEPFHGQYAALAIPYHACDDEDDSADGVFNEIKSRWEAQT